MREKMNNDDLEVNSQNFEVMNADINEERTPMPRSGRWHWVPGHVEGGAWIAGYWEQD